MLPKIVIFAIFLLCLSACAVATPLPTATAIPSLIPTHTLTVTPAPTDTPAPSATATATLSPWPEIQTVAESLIITKVELKDKFMFDDPAPDGKQFLMVWLSRLDGIDIDVLYFLKVEPRSSEIALMLGDGTTMHLSGFGNFEKQVFVRFTVPTGLDLTQCQFYWPDNPLIMLGK